MLLRLLAVQTLELIRNLQQAKKTRLILRKNNPSLYAKTEITKDVPNK